VPDLLHVHHHGHFAAVGGAVFLLDCHHLAGSLRLRRPCCLPSVHLVLFGWGGLTGLVLSDAAADPQYHNAYFLVAHFHYALYPTTVMGAMAAIVLLAAQMDRPHAERALGKPGISGWRWWAST
jgi:cytochrome c oxidase subunit 1